MVQSPRPNPRQNLGAGSSRGAADARANATRNANSRANPVRNGLRSRAGGNGRNAGEASSASNRGDVPLRPRPVSEAMRDCGVYVDGNRVPGEFDHRSALEEVKTRGEGFVWLSLSRPDATQMDAIAEEYGLHELTVEDALTHRQRPKVELHDDHLVFVLRSIHYSPEGTSQDHNEKIDTGQLLMVLGRNYILTIRMGMPSDDMNRLAERVDEDPELLQPGPAGVLCALALFAVGTATPLLSVPLTALLAGCMHGVNLMLISFLPPCFARRHGSAAVVSGLFNSCVYIGSSLSTYGIALLSAEFGWRVTLFVWFLIAAAGTAVCFACVKPWNRSYRV